MKMEMECEIISREIPLKGIAYLVLRHTAPERAAAVLLQAAEDAYAQGAVEVLAASMTPDVLFWEREVGKLRLEHVHDMLVLERSLSGIPCLSGRLQLKPLTQEQGEFWLNLHNETFFSVPNSATYDGYDLRQALSKDWQCGFVLESGAVVGIYEIDASGTVPEIAGIALREEARGRGLGRELLCTVMGRLRGQGHQKCCLIVSDANQTAYALYQSMGFACTQIKSRWFRLHLTG